ncbi:MAG TPA: ester cyclase [Streptosporangiaceae bacterium]|nr:ester cyclase [Streptosporangiaceae bacterium]
MAESFVALMRRYCVDYTARHDLSVCDDIMDPGYTLHMGTHDLAGRDDAYKPAAAAQFRQFPGLCLTVSEIVCAGDRLALRFTEHGASARHDGAQAAWAGIGLYRWDGQRLLENYVEQDYLARRRQLAEGRPDPVEPPAVAPWDTRSVPADRAAEEVVRTWLGTGDLSRVTADDGLPPHRLIAPARTDVSVLFSAGPRVAFHAVRHGPLTGEDPRFAGDGEAFVHVAGVVLVEGGQVAGGRVVRDRLGLLRRLMPRESMART